MFSKVSQYGDWGLFFLRLTVGVIFIYHSVPKLTNTAGMAEGMGFSYWFVLLLGLAELLSGVALIVGIKTQLAALLLGVVMLGAIYFKMFAWAVPFAAGNRTGWEFDLVLLAAAAAIFLTGGGRIGLHTVRRDTV